MRSTARSATQRLLAGVRALDEFRFSESVPWSGEPLWQVLLRESPDHKLEHLAAGSSQEKGCFVEAMGKLQGYGER